MLVRLLRNAVPNERQRLFALTLISGGACGLAAVAFHELIVLVSRFAIDPALAAPGRTWIWWTLLVPTLGGLAAGLLLHYVPTPTERVAGRREVGRGPTRAHRGYLGKVMDAAA